MYKLGRSHCPTLCTHCLVPPFRWMVLNIIFFVFVLLLYCFDWLIHPAVRRILPPELCCYAPSVSHFRPKCLIVSAEIKNLGGNSFAPNGQRSICKTTCLSFPHEGHTPIIRESIELWIIFYYNGNSSFHAQIRSGKHWGKHQAPLEANQTRMGPRESQI